MWRGYLAVPFPFRVYATAEEEGGRGGSSMAYAGNSFPAPMISWSGGATGACNSDVMAMGVSLRNVVTNSNRIPVVQNSNEPDKYHHVLVLLPSLEI